MSTKLIQVAFYVGPTTWYGWLVKLFTMSDISHCGIIDIPNSNEVLEASSADGRIKRTKIDPDNWMYITLPVEKYPDFTDIKYDNLGAIFSWTWLKRIQNPRRMYCSEFCVWYLNAAGYKTKIDSQLTPSQLYASIYRTLEGIQGDCHE